MNNHFLQRGVDFLATKFDKELNRLGKRIEYLFERIGKEENALKRGGWYALYGILGARIVATCAVLGGGGFGLVHLGDGLRRPVISGTDKWALSPPKNREEDRDLLFAYAILDTTREQKKRLRDMDTAIFHGININGLNKMLGQRLRALPEDWGNSSRCSVTPLMAAAACGDMFMVEKFLALGADPEVQDEKGRTALSYAVYREREDVAETLLEKFRPENSGKKVVELEHLCKVTKELNARVENYLKSYLPPVDLVEKFTAVAREKKSAYEAAMEYASEPILRTEVPVQYALPNRRKLRQPRQ